MKRILLLAVMAVGLVVGGCTHEFIKVGNPTPSPLPELPSGIDNDTPSGGGDGPVVPEGSGKAFWSKNPKWAGDTAEGAVYATVIDAEGETLLVAGTTFKGVITADISFDDDGSFISDGFMDGLKLAGSVTDSKVKLIDAGEKTVADLAKAEFDDILLFVSSKIGSETAEEMDAAKSEWDAMEKKNKQMIDNAGKFLKP